MAIAMPSPTALIGCIALWFGIWFTQFDADFITFFYDIHRSYLPNNNLSTKTIWIIGASSGVGENLVYELISSGCTKLILSSRRVKQMQRVKTEALKLANNAQNIEIIIKPLDLYDFATKDGYNDEFVNKLMKEIPFDKIDILVLNSAFVPTNYALDDNITILQKVSQINTFGPILLLQSIIKHWINTKTDNDHYQISFTSTLASKLGAPRIASYCMSKSAMNLYLETLRMELLDEPIDINIVYLGYIKLNKYSLNEEYKTRDKGIIEMTVERCTHLYVTVLEYNIIESVVSGNPYLLFAYIKQYVPILSYPITKLALPIVDKTYKKPKE
eukprot:511272_1